MPVTGPERRCSWPTPDATLRRHLHGLVHGQDPPGYPSRPQLPRGNSRLDHALVSPSLFPFIHSCGISSPTQDSDHCPLVMNLHLPFTPPSTPSTHSFHSGTPLTRWVWDSTKRPAYVTACSTQSSSSFAHTHKLDIDLTSVLFIKHLFCNMSLLLIANALLLDPSKALARQAGNTYNNT